MQSDTFSECYFFAKYVEQLIAFAPIEIKCVENSYQDSVNMLYATNENGDEMIICPLCSPASNKADYMDRLELDKE